MYTVLENTQILIALLKEYGIKHIVISPGTRNGPFVHSVEEDSFFSCYSVVDERSAGFFALGIAKELGEPVVLSCTSSTAACNYYSAIVEARYSQIPLIILTSDRSPYTREQYEKQQIIQVGMYGEMTKKTVDLPMNITNEDERWYCERLINEALLEMSHHGFGPVQINLPVYYNMRVFSEKELPKVSKISRNNLRIPYTTHELDLVGFLHNKKRIMVICGASRPWSDLQIELVEQFAEKYNCIVAFQHMSNTRHLRGLNITAGTDLCNCLDSCPPEVVISIGGPLQLMYFEKIRNNDIQHWLVCDDGLVHDPTRHLTEIFETPFETFFSYFVSEANQEWKNDNEYKDQVELLYSQFVKSREELNSLTNIYIAKKLCEKIPDNSLLGMSILNAIRNVESFELPTNVEVCANVGAYGIDGCMSTFLGQAYVSGKQAFLIIGDLSFIYDMNSIWIRHIGDNVHILLINNYEGIEMHRFFRSHGDLRRHITAGHSSSPKGWIEENGFEYYSASTKDEFDEKIDEFIASRKKCVFEVFTNECDDTAEAFRFYGENETLKNNLKESIKNVLGSEGVYKLKKILGKTDSV